MSPIQKYKLPISPEEQKTICPQKYYRVLSELFSNNKNVFESESSLKESVIEYFAFVQAQNESPTITGLCAYLNITRKNLTQICNSDHPYSKLLSKVKAALVDRAERMLLDGKPSPNLIFWLKNVDDDNWSDKHTLDTNLNVSISSILTQLEKEKEKYIDGEIINSAEKFYSDSSSDSDSGS